MTILTCRWTSMGLYPINTIRSIWEGPFASVQRTGCTQLHRNHDVLQQHHEKRSLLLRSWKVLFLALLRHQRGPGGIASAIFVLNGPSVALLLPVHIGGSSNFLLREESSSVCFFSLSNHLRVFNATRPRPLCSARYLRRPFLLRTLFWVLTFELSIGSQLGTSA